MVLGFLMLVVLGAALLRAIDGIGTNRSDLITISPDAYVVSYEQARSEARALERNYSVIDSTTFPDYERVIKSGGIYFGWKNDERFVLNQNGKAIFEPSEFGFPMGPGASRYHRVFVWQGFVIGQTGAMQCILGADWNCVSSRYHAFAMTERGLLAQVGAEVDLLNPDPYFTIAAAIDQSQEIVPIDLSYPESTFNYR